MSPSVCNCSDDTVPLAPSARARPFTCSCASTLRSVTGIMAGPLSPSAKRSTTPKGAAANLASGGISPAATLSGNIWVFDSVRPLTSLKPDGNSIRYEAFSGKGGLKAIVLTSSLLSSSPKKGLIEPSRMPSASLRGTGALKFSTIGRIGKQPAWAFSRSQLNSAVKGCRTLNSKRFSSLLAIPLGVATPFPMTRRMRAPDGSGRPHASAT